MAFRSLSGKKLEPNLRMTDYQAAILGGLQNKNVYGGTVSDKEKNRRRKKKQHSELDRKRLRRRQRSDEMLTKWEKQKGLRGVRHG